MASKKEQPEEQGPSEFSLRLDELKAELGIESDRELSKLCGFPSPTHITTMRRRKSPAADTIAKLAKHTGASLKWLITGEGDMMSAARDLSDYDRGREEYLDTIDPRIRGLAEGAVQTIMHEADKPPLVAWQAVAAVLAFHEDGKEVTAQNVVPLAMTWLADLKGKSVGGRVLEGDE